MSAHGAKIALMVSDVYIDSNIFIYAIDGSGELKTKAKARLEQLVAEGFHLHSSEIAIGECLRGVDRSKEEPARQFMTMLENQAFVTLAPVTRRIIERAAAIGAEFRLKLVDAIHVATAETLGCQTFLTNDRGIRAPAGIAIEAL